LAFVLLAASPCKPLPDTVKLKVSEKKCFKLPAATKSVSVGEYSFDAQMTAPDQVDLEGIEPGTSHLLVILPDDVTRSVEVTVR
jgi:hypothetical protein